MAIKETQQDIHVYFLAAGLVATYKDGKLVPELSESWLLLWAETMFKKYGLDLTSESVTIHMPDHRLARLYRTAGGFLKVAYLPPENSASSGGGPMGGEE